MSRTVKTVATLIRLSLTAVLLVLVYGETGPWTVATLTCIAIGSELHRGDDA